jgi:hypothetical protein
MGGSAAFPAKKVVRTIAVVTDEIGGIEVVT